jgi:hypothetical protein
MPSRQVLHFILNAAVFIAFACEANIAVAANVMPKSALKPATSNNLRLQPSYAMALPPDNDDCQDDYIGQMFNYAKREQMPTDLPKTQLAMLDRTEKTAESVSKTDYLPDNMTLALLAKEQTPVPRVKTEAPLKVLAATPPIETVAAVPAVWEIALADKTLNAAMARWTVLAGWQLLWELPVDYAVEAHTAVPGSFEQAVETVAHSMEGAEIPMKAIFYKGNKVLRIVQKGVK